MSIISLDNVSKVYETGDIKTIALSDVTFNVGQAEFMSIMGPSGSGKSTLLHILGLLDRPSSGDYSFFGRSIQDFSDEELAYLRNEKIGFIFQRFNLLKRATVFDNVLLPLHYSTIPRSKWKSLVEQAISSVGLEHRMYHNSGQLSGGESQRVAIARAIVNEPDLIFADEPTGNLDSVSGEQIMNIIADLHKKGRTVILITHESSAAAYGQRIIKLKDGKLVSDRKQRKARPKKFTK